MKAIEILREAIKVQEEWAVYFEAPPSEAKLPVHKKNLGPASFHREVMKEYAQAIFEIETMRARNSDLAAILKLARDLYPANIDIAVDTLKKDNGKEIAGAINELRKD